MTGSDFAIFAHILYPGRSFLAVCDEIDLQKYQPNTNTGWLLLHTYGRVAKSLKEHYLEPLRLSWFC